MRGATSAPPKLTGQERAVFWSALKTLFAAGISLDRSFVVLSRQFEDRPLAKTCLGIADRLRRGGELAQALTSAGCFSAFSVAVVETGCRTGALSVLLDRLADHEQRNYRLQSRVKASFYYPLFTIVLALGFLLVVPPMILGGIFPLLEGLGTKLNWGTRMLGWVARCVGHPLFYVALVGAAALAWYAWRKAMRDEDQLVRLEQLMGRVPQLRDTWNSLVLCRFAESLSVALGSGSRIDLAVRLSARASGSLLLLRRCPLVCQALIEGESLNEALETTRYFPRLFIQTVKVGEESGSLSRLLNSVAQMYEQDFEHRAEGLATLLEPLFLAGVGLIVGVLAITAISPLVQLVKDL